ncbi:MAG: hypothetical protein AABX34_03305 [Nanoarchaeota archaeon]
MKNYNFDNIGKGHATGTEPVLETVSETLLPTERMEAVAEITKTGTGGAGARGEVRIWSR